MQLTVLIRILVQQNNIAATFLHLDSGMRQHRTGGIDNTEIERSGLNSSFVDEQIPAAVHPVRGVHKLHSS